MNGAETFPGDAFTFSPAFHFPSGLCCRNPGGPGCCMDGNNAAGDGDAGDDGASECECGAALPLPSALAPEGSESPFALGAPAGPDDVDLSEGFQRIGVATDAAAFRRTRTASGRSLPSRDLRNPRRASAAGDTPSPSADSQFGLANSPRSSGPRRTVGAPAPRVKTEPETAEDTDEAFGGDEAAEAETKKRRKVPNSCTNCKRSHLSCDPFRPCLRCARKGLECVDSVPKVPAPRGQGPKAKEKARLAELRRQHHHQPTRAPDSSFECTMDDAPMLSPASVSRTSSNTPRSLFSEPSARVAGVIRPTVTKLKRPPGSHRPMPIPDMMNAQLLGQLQQYSASALGSNDPRLDLSAALLLGVLDPATATTPSSATSAAFQMAPTTTNPMLSEFTDLDALTADLLAGTDLSVSAGIDRFDSFGSGMAASVVVVDGDEDDYSSSIAPSQFVQQAEADPIVPLSALPDPIGFDIEDLGNSRFVDQLVFGAAGGGVGGMDADADLDAGSRGDPRSEPRGSVAAIPASERKRSTSRKLGAREQPRIATGLGFGCPGRHGPGEVCESCPFSVGERYYLVAAGDTWSCAAISDPWDGLQQLLKIKRDAGLLVPHRPAEGYARLLRWLDASHWTEPGKARLRTAIEELWNLLEEDNRQTQNSNSSAAAKEDQLLHSAEYFERLCLLADRMFAGSGVPSAMWRRTGELARCNTEFAALVGLPAEDLLGKTAYAIYELMDEASAGSFFEALARLAPDAGQKAILLPTTLNNRYNNKAQPSPISCSASFTIHREPWSGVPCAVIGNFLPMAPPDPAEMVRAKMAAFGLRNAPADTDGGAEDEVRRLLGKGRLKRGLSGMLGRTTTPPTPVGLAFGAGTEGGGDFVDGMVL